MQGHGGIFARSYSLRGERYKMPCEINQFSFVSVRVLLLLFTRTTPRGTNEKIKQANQTWKMKRATVFCEQRKSNPKTKTAKCGRKKNKKHYRHNPQSSRGYPRVKCAGTGAQSRTSYSRETRVRVCLHNTCTQLHKNQRAMQ